MTEIKKEKTKSVKKIASKTTKAEKKTVKSKPAAKPVVKAKITPQKTAPAKRRAVLPKKKEIPILPIAAPIEHKQEKVPPVVPEQVLPKAAHKEQIIKEEVKPVKTQEVKEPKREVSAQKEAPAVAVEAKPELKELELELPINVKDLSIKMQEKPSTIIKSLMDMRVMAGINQFLEESAVIKICDKFGFKIKKAPDKEELALQTHYGGDLPQNLKSRSPIVTFMGHVDHGKTSLLDAIRKAKVVETEHGGITQHIGAYKVDLPGGRITFLDTPGHEAFTAMRARGASITDIVVLVVAADEGIMPQTREAIDHARAAGVPIIVAANKIDKPEANLDRIKKQLAEFDLRAEDWGGKTITVGVSAKTGQGIDQLLEMILLEAQMLELKANPNTLARGVVVEAKINKGKGILATLLVQNGTLRLNDNIIIGQHLGKVRAMFDDHARAIAEAGPTVPVEILGLSGVPEAGEQFFVVEDEKKARELALIRQEKEKQQQMIAPKKISLEDLYSQIKEGKIKELKIIVKSDVQGSLEAIKEVLNKLNVSEIKLSIIHEGVGNINYSDVVLAVASNALILGFNVTWDDRAKELINKEGVDARTYNIIYELANDIKAALEGMLEPKSKKVFLGRVEIRKVFKLSRSGIIAGSYVVKGKITRSAQVSVVRNGEVVFEGKVSSLKRFKDDVREVAEGFECGLSVAGFDDIKEGDIIEAYDIEKIARKL